MKAESQNIEERSVNYVQVNIVTESGCDIEEGEYSMYIAGFIGGLDLNTPGGVDDISLIKDCIWDKFDFSKLPEEGIAEITLKESGEWEDVFWHKYYEIERVVYH